MVANLQYDPAIQIRPIEETHLDAVAALEARMYPYPWTRGIFADCLKAGYSCWALMADDELIGYSIVSVAAGEAHLLNLCVHIAHQRAGLGRRLLARMIDVARWHHAQRMFLEVRPSNFAAVALYQRAAFEVVGRRRNYYPDVDGREDALVMALQIRQLESATGDQE